MHGRSLASGPLHPVVLGQPIGTLWNNIRAKATTRSPPCRPDVSVSPLQVPAAAPSVRGHTPETRAASSDMPPHHPACMRARCDAPVALLPPVPPSRLTLYRLTTRSSPLTLHGRALTSGPPHPVVVGQPIGTLWSNIRARPTAKSPPCRPHASVSPLQVPAAAPSVRGGHTPDRRPASSDMPPHHHACMRARCDALVALLPQGPRLA